MPCSTTGDTSCTEYLNVRPYLGMVCAVTLFHDDLRRSAASSMCGWCPSVNPAVPGVISRSLASARSAGATSMVDNLTSSSFFPKSTLVAVMSMGRCTLVQFGGYTITLT